MRRYTLNLIGPCFIPLDLPSVCVKKTYTTNIMMFEGEFNDMLYVSEEVYQKLSRQLCSKMIQDWTAPVGYFSVGVEITKEADKIYLSVSLTVVDQLDNYDQSVPDTPISSLTHYMCSSLITATATYISELNGHLAELAAGSI